MVVYGQSTKEGHHTMFTVIENTPGYMPDSDDPATFDSYAEAVEYLNAEVERYVEELHESGYPTPCINPGASSGNYAASWVGNGEPNDLGRWFAVELVEFTEEDPDPVTRLGTPIHWPAVEPGPITDESERSAA